MANPKRPRDPNQLTKFIVANGDCKNACSTSPAMAAGVSERLWEVADIAALVEEAENAPKKRGSYKKSALP